MNTRPTIVHLPDLDAHGLEPYRTLRRQSEHLKEGIFVGEGEKVVRRLLRSGLGIRSLLLTPEWFSALFPGETLAEQGGFTPGACIFIAGKQLLETIVGFSLHQGIMAVGLTPPEGSLTDVVPGPEQPPALLVALDNLVNAENVGVVVRNAAAFGADAILCGETSSSPWLRRAVRASMGTVFDVRIRHESDLAGTLGRLRSQHGMTVLAADPSGAEALYGTSLTGPVCVVLGHEGTGIRPGVLGACDRSVAIPMWRNTDSLNVGSAAAVFLAEARRQRHRGRAD